MDASLSSTGASVTTGRREMTVCDFSTVLSLINADPPRCFGRPLILHLVTRMKRQQHPKVAIKGQDGRPNRGRDLVRVAGSSRLLKEKAPLSGRCDRCRPRGGRKRPVFGVFLIRTCRQPSRLLLCPIAVQI